MQIQQRINAFRKLGELLTSQVVEDTNLIRRVTAANGWFTEDNIQYALKSWSEALTEDNLEKWLSGYDLAGTSPKTVAIIMAGNIPLVGFHDFLTVLISGHNALIKLSSNDTILLPHIADILEDILGDFKHKIKFSEDKLNNFDAVIATGSNNTARYFDYYFGKYPGIIRRNRNSVAVLNGGESPEQLKALGDDIFRYFGLGCRNVSKLFVPEHYDFTPFFEAIFNWRHVIENHKYMNNYDYNKAVYLMSNIKLLDNEFIVLKEDSNYSSPISVLFYEYYKSTQDLQQRLNSDKEKIQAVIANCGLQGEIAFGRAQSPELWEYADGTDTLQLLQQL